MTNEERNEMRNLMNILDTAPYGSEEREKAYDRYFELRAKEQEEFRSEHLDKLRKFYDERIAGREWKDIDQEDWDWYSDYHKDVFGYRPRGNTFGALEAEIGREV